MPEIGLRYSPYPPNGPLNRLTSDLGTGITV